MHKAVLAFFSFRFRNTAETALLALGPRRPQRELTAHDHCRDQHQRNDSRRRKAKAMPAGSFVSMPAKMHHFAFSTKESIVEVSAMGPFQIDYVDPKDDPSKTPPK